MEKDYFKYVDNFSKYKEVNSKLIIAGKVKAPKITIAIPTYKRNFLIKDAIDSAINQIGFENYEIIIVDNDDDFNNHELKKIIEEYKNDKIFYYKNEKNIGMFGNWNRCIELAKGEYISILNDDDWLEKNFLEKTLKYLSGEKAIYTDMIINDFREIKYLKESKVKKYLKIIYAKLKKIKKTREFNIEDFFYGNRSAGSLGILFNRVAMLELGGYNEEYFPSSDYFFHANYCHKYGIVLLKENLCHYRVQANESMKKEVVINWIMLGEDFRKFLIRNFLKEEKYLKESNIINEIFKKNLLFWNFKIEYNPKMANNKRIKIRELIKNIF